MRADAAKGLMPGAVEAGLRQIFDNDTNVRAVIISGSYARGTPDQISDLDVILILHNGPQRQFYQPAGDIELDVFCDSLPALQTQLSTLRKSNNNFLLNSLAKSVVYVDRDGSGAKLVHDATALWEKGPDALSKKERKSRLSALLRLENATRHLVLRADRSPEDRFLAEIRCGDLFRHALTDYMCFANRWTSGLKETLSWIKKDDEPFSELCVAYIEAQSVEVRFATAGVMVARATDLANLLS